MPIPKPNDGESQDKFISRCMGNDTMNADYPDNEQRAAICYSSWKDTKKSLNIVNTPFSIIFRTEDK